MNVESFLDRMLTPDEAAEWLNMTRTELGRKSRGGNGVAPAPIPAFIISRECVRYHPRTIIAKLAKDADVPMAVMAASLNLEAKL